MDPENLQIVLWLLAGLASFYFSIGNARVWTSISLGFVLILLAEVLPAVLPLLPDWRTPQLQAVGPLAGILAITLITQGFQEYYMFSRTLEEEGEKLHVYLGVLAGLVAALLFLYLNPTPTPEIIQTLILVENSCWVVLAVINIGMVRKIVLAVKDTPIYKGFMAFFPVFGFILLWKGATLYLQVYAQADFADHYPLRHLLLSYTQQAGHYLAAISVAAAFLYLTRLLR